MGGCLRKSSVVLAVRDGGAGETVGNGCGVI